MKAFPVLWQPCSRTERLELERLAAPRTVPWSLVAPHEAQAREADRLRKVLADAGVETRPLDEHATAPSIEGHYAPFDLPPEHRAFLVLLNVTDAMLPPDAP